MRSVKLILELTERNVPLVSSVQNSPAWQVVDQKYNTSSETDLDVATRLISLDDDPTLPAFTFRMWFLGIGLSCFGAVLGQIFVSLILICAQL